MPSCRECKWLTEEGSCGVGHSHPLRNCVTAIMLEYAALLQASQNVLEVGCGAWSPLKEQADQVGCRWEGIDVNDTYNGNPTVATKVASVAAIPFDDGEFDLVVATQSMEHWEEYRVDLYKGLSEVFRVLKPGGLALVNVPIHFHGGTRFVLGRLEEIKSIFEEFSEDVHMEAWRLPSDPLAPHRYQRRFYWHKPSLWNKSSYVLDIHAKRKPVVPYFDRGPINSWTKLWIGLRDRGPMYYGSILVFITATRIKRKISSGFRRTTTDNRLPKDSDS